MEKGEFYQYRTLYYIQSNHKDVTNRRITVKVLSRVDIEEIAERILNEYRKLPEIKNRELYRIDTDVLLTRVLNLNIEYAHLSSDESILGLTSFDEVDMLVYDETDEEYILCLDGKTVVIEISLHFYDSFVYDIKFYID